MIDNAGRFRKGRLIAQLVLGHPVVMPPSLYEFAGGGEALLRLARAHHVRCLADPELNHPFSHPDQHPEHVERLAAYWGEVFGGPETYSRECGSQSQLLTMHAGNGDMTDLARRFVECFVAACDDADLPPDPRFRAALREYMEWATSEFNSYPSDASAVPAGLATPRWGWSGRSAISVDDDRSR